MRGAIPLMSHYPDTKYHHMSNAPDVSESAAAPPGLPQSPSLVSEYRREVSVITPQGYGMRS